MEWVKSMVTIKIDKKQTKVGLVELVTLKNDVIELTLTSYGAAIYQLLVEGQAVHVGPKNLDQFLSDPLYYGKTVGRTAGRLWMPGYHISNKFIPIEPNDGQTKLHGGALGFSFQHFSVKQMNYNNNEVSCSFMYFSKHLEEGYRGNLELTVTYTLNRYNEVSIIYDAITDQDTLCNLTNHIYFNLSKDSENVLNHRLYLDADQYLDIDEDVKIKGKKDVSNSPFDFRKEKSIHQAIDVLKDTPLLGLDHTFLLNSQKQCVIMSEPSFDYRLVCSTTYPAVVIYTHNQPSKKQLERIKHDGFQSGITLEFMFEPGGIHHPDLNHAILRKKEPYHHEIKFKFDKIT